MAKLRCISPVSQDFALRLHWAAVDGFAIAVVGVLVALVAWLWLLGRSATNSGVQPLGMRSGRPRTWRRCSRLTTRAGGAAASAR